MKVLRVTGGRVYQSARAGGDLRGIKVCVAWSGKLTMFGILKVHGSLILCKTLFGLVWCDVFVFLRSVSFGLLVCRALFSFPQDHIFEGLLGGLPYAVAVRAHNEEAGAEDADRACVVGFGPQYQLIYIVWWFPSVRRSSRIFLF